MTKAKLVDAVVRRVGLTDKEARTLIDFIFNEIRQALVKDKVVKIANFGRFELRYRPARMARNPKTNKYKPIEGRHVVFFKPADYFRERVNERDISATNVI